MGYLLCMFRWKLTIFLMAPNCILLYFFAVRVCEGQELLWAVSREGRLSGHVSIRRHQLWWSGRNTWSCECRGKNSNHYWHSFPSWITFVHVNHFSDHVCDKSSTSFVCTRMKRYTTLLQCVESAFLFSLAVAFIFLLSAYTVRYMLLWCDQI